jgi:hypothetical protein
MSGKISAERLFDSDWGCLLSLMPDGWQGAARELGAFCWGRQVRNAEDLLRLCLAYAMGGMSLRTTAAWAEQRGLVPSLSDVALLKRLTRAPEWLSWIVRQKLAERVALPGWAAPGLRVRLLDATALSRPGSAGTDWRLHLSFGLATWGIDSAELTDSSGGETLRRISCRPGDIVVADRAYPNRAGIHSVVESGGHVVVRMAWQNLPLRTLDGQPFPLFERLRSLPPGRAGDWGVETVPDAKRGDTKRGDTKRGDTKRGDTKRGDTKRGVPAIAGRVVAVRKSEEAAENSRRRLRREAGRKGKTPSKESLEAAGYVFVLTTLPGEDFPAERVLELYRFRWQVELAFKRMKGILHLGEMTARCDDLCRTFLLAKLLIVLLVEDLSRRYADFSPWGYGRPAAAVPVEGVAGPRRGGAAGDRNRAVHPGLGGAARPAAAGILRHAAQTA